MRLDGMPATFRLSPALLLLVGGWPSPAENSLRGDERFGLSFPCGWGFPFCLVIWLPAGEARLGASSLLHAGPSSPAWLSEGSGPGSTRPRQLRACV